MTKIKSSKESKPYILDIYKDIAKKYNIHVDDVKRLHKEYFEIINDVMLDINMPTINIIGFGRLKPKKKRLFNTYVRVYNIKKRGGEKYLGYDIDEVLTSLNEAYKRCFGNYIKFD